MTQIWPWPVAAREMATVAMVTGCCYCSGAGRREAEEVHGDETKTLDVAA